MAAMTATIPRKTGLILRSLWRVAAVVMGLPGLSGTHGTGGGTARPYRAQRENVSRGPPVPSESGAGPTPCAGAAACPRPPPGRRPRGCPRPLTQLLHFLSTVRGPR
ncbi:hypothetical protein GCM10009535_24990 [Streptomyces thermocarboxydovorans]|uniref:Secreted protein n=1 Tax=Streptomyces thermocarboxydovorans TaxID=59298 RepID=A0ABP3SR66_9ACTN